ncbi:MAG: polyprenyl diphosphate synthase [Parachlamydiaceae bacterium]|nr:polyprenyl diphosphate synthase [Parachlamydiaceae bacterium]
MSLNNVVSTVDEESFTFDRNQLLQIDFTRIPQHIAIIPDGNRRWAKRQFFDAAEGHREGADTLTEIVKAANELNIKSITFYSFSTENWNRPPEEIAALMLILNIYLVNQCESMIQNGVKLNTIGELSPLPSFLQETIEKTKEATKECEKINLILALNYGSRNELARTFRTMVDDYDKKILTKEDFNESMISRYLDTHPWGDPDLLIRTSGELRLSNFLLWQLSYSEIHIAPVLWPDFTPQHLVNAILDYQNRQRRWGE